MARTKGPRSPRHYRKIKKGGTLVPPFPQVHNRKLLRGSCARFADINRAIEVLELDLRTAAVDGAAHCTVELHTVAPAFAFTLFDYRFHALRRHRYVEVTVDVAAIR